MSSREEQSVAPGGERNAAIERGMCFEIVLSGGNFTLLAEGMGSHWQPLDELARTKYREISEGNNFAHRVVARHMHQLPKMPPMADEEVIILLIRRFLDQTNGQASVEDAAVYLARSFWDVRHASYRWIDPDNYAAIGKDEIWGDEENDESHPGKHPNVHEVSVGCRPSIEISLTDPSDGSSSRPKEYHPAFRSTKRFSGPRTSS